jgi:hypothetical protein
MFQTHIVHRPATLTEVLVFLLSPRQTSGPSPPTPVQIYYLLFIHQWIRLLLATRMNHKQKRKNSVALTTQGMNNMASYKMLGVWCQRLVVMTKTIYKQSVNIIHSDAKAETSVLNNLDSCVTDRVCLTWETPEFHPDVDSFIRTPLCIQAFIHTFVRTLFHQN